jgi:uncharacterized protein YjbI with pentapeptide repeats
MPWVLTFSNSSENSVIEYLRNEKSTSKRLIVKQFAISEVESYLPRCRTMTHSSFLIIHMFLHSEGSDIFMSLETLNVFFNSVSIARTKALSSPLYSSTVDIGRSDLTGCSLSGVRLYSSGLRSNDSELRFRSYAVCWSKRCKSISIVVRSSTLTRDHWRQQLCGAGMQGAITHKCFSRSISGRYSCRGL